MTKINGLISIARKAGYVIVGLEKLKNYDKKLYLLLIDKTAGGSLQREMNFISQKRNVPLLCVEELDKIISTENCKAIGIKNKLLSDNIIECLKGE